MTVVTADEAREMIACHLAAIDELQAQLEVLEAPVRRSAPSGALTRRELQVARAFAWSGMSIVAIARDLFVSTNTAKTHLRVAYRKLEVHNRVELRRALMAVEQVPVGEPA